jgi:hypothetical protein
VNSPLSESHARAITGAITTLGAAGAIAAFVSLSLPWAAGWIVVVVGVVVWSYRRALPTPSQALFVAVLAAGIGFAIAWYEETQSQRVYDYVVVPKKVVAVQYAFPGPRHESTSSSLFGYGEHVEVDCYLQGYDEKPWLALANGNFMPADELTPAELSGEEAPSC